ncbi:hypothetical protein AVEN_129516-1 [Araneus ventricosus]|uniref:Uncharacterized protein n=1 Tax=Araneus ventricosus TaxID=182803 RepID=A0A4Y2GL89_ARAVE|nr:hypothetical protein AVEN_129516-1 [Araneus ventricosus]
MTRATPELAPPLQTFAPHQREDVWPTIYDLNCTRPPYMADFQWNLVSNLEPSGPEVKTPPRSRFDLEILMNFRILDVRPKTTLLELFLSLCLRMR